MRLRPDRVIVSDNCSTDGTEQFVKGFKGIPVEWQQNESNLGPGKNMNKAFNYAAETDFLHVLHADDVLDPKFYETMTKAFDGCAGRGIGWCLDERIDENTLLDLDRDGNICGITIEHARDRAEIPKLSYEQISA